MRVLKLAVPTEAVHNQGALPAPFDRKSKVRPTALEGAGRGSYPPHGGPDVAGTKHRHPRREARKDHTLFYLFQVANGASRLPLISNRRPVFGAR
jgi:hypothetical protein